MNDETPSTPSATETATENPTARAAENPAINGGGAGGDAGDAQFLENLQRASAGAVEQHIAESPEPKRGRGRPRKTPARLPDGRFVPKNPAPLGHAAAAPGVDEIPAPLLSGDVPGGASDAPPVDAEEINALVEIGCGLLNDGACAIVRAVAMRETGDKALADGAAKEVAMSDKVEAAIKKGAQLCARKYAMRAEYAPEMILFGGLIIWCGQISLSVRALKAKGAELRAEQSKAQ